MTKQKLPSFVKGYHRRTHAYCLLPKQKQDKLDNLWKKVEIVGRKHRKLCYKFWLIAYKLGIPSNTD